MLVIKCAGCKKKLWKYDKIGQGKVLRCHKDRITRTYDFVMDKHKVKCNCGQIIGLDKGSYFQMVAKGFTYSGTKRK